MIKTNCSEIKTNNSNKIKNILILDNGGTVSMKRTEDVLYPVDGKEDILNLIYQIKCPVKIDYIKVNSIDSTNMSPLIMKLIYDGIIENYNKYDGFVVLTGTDTLSYLACFLSFWLLGIRKPVVITGSQKPLNEMGSDAPGNIYYSILFARENIPEVTVFFCEELYRGNRVVKVDSRGFKAFDSYKYPPIAYVDAFNLRVYSPLVNLINPLEKEKFKFSWSPEVNIVKLYPGIKPEVISILPDLGYKGIIIEAFGLGNLPNEGEYSLEGTIKTLVEKGLIVGICSQCLKGAVKVEYDTAKKFQKLNVVFLRDITTEAAYAKMSWLLGQSSNRKWLRENLTEPVAGEMSIWDS